MQAQQTLTSDQKGEKTFLEGSSGQRKPRSFFYVWIAVAMSATALIGFIPTFWAPMARGAHPPSPIITIHGLVFSAWPLFLVMQTWFMATGRTSRHREVGLIGIALATAMTIFGVMAAINVCQRAAAIGALDAGLTSMILPILEILLFAILVTCAIANIRRPEWHKRLLIVATAMILDASIARPFLFYLVFHGHMPVPAGFPSPPPPVFTGYPMFLLADLFIIIPALYDWRKRGRPHPAYLIGLAAIVLMRLLRPALSVTPAWRAIASWIFSLAG
jgi:hypothetical protein